MEAGIALLLALKKKRAPLPLTSQLLLATLSLKITVVSKLIPCGNSFGLLKENIEVKKKVTT
ncbi:MAG: hypothetical protein O7C72_00250 [Deltaproteobacteria bacterium]|nr:hypothetical protein [Deltaproteobacteria bacterium]